MAITDGPYYEIHSPELAKWVDGFGWNHWWMIDGDRYITGWVGSPCRGDELAAVLHRAARPIVIQAPADDTAAKGQVIQSGDVGRLAGRIGDSVYQIDRSLPPPSWADDKCFWMAWKGDANEWLLSEDSDTTRAFANTKTTPNTVVSYGRL